MFARFSVVLCALGLMSTASGLATARVVSISRSLEVQYHDFGIHHAAAAKRARKAKWRSKVHCRFNSARYRCAIVRRPR